jgi:hypothetical protein
VGICPTEVVQVLLLLQEERLTQGQTTGVQGTLSEREGEEREGERGRERERKRERERDREGTLSIHV